MKIILKKIVFLLTTGCVGLILLGSKTMSQPKIEHINLVGTNVYPEGIAIHPKTKEIFISSLRKGEIQRIFNGKSRYFKRSGEEGLITTTGMAIDPETNNLWVCNSDFGLSIHSKKDEMPRGEIRVYNINSTRLKASFVLSSPGPHLCNDIALDRQGNAYITDSFSPTIWKVNADLSHITSFVENELLRGQPFGLNGIALTPNHQYLIVTLTEGKLLRVDLHTKKVVPIKINGSDKLASADGIVFAEENILYVADFPNPSKVMLNNNYTEGTVMKLTSKEVMENVDFPTTLAIDNKHLFVTNSQADHIFPLDPNVPPDFKPNHPFTITSIPLHKIK